MSEQDTIYLQLVDDSWMATFVGTESYRIAELFGTTTIPTPFRAAMDGENVKARIQKRNPDSRVVLAPRRLNEGVDPKLIGVDARRIKHSRTW